MELDSKDKIIIECLMQDCRMPVKRIAKLAHLTHPAVLYRIKRLEKEKYIDRYDALINLNKLVPAHFFFVRVRNKDKKKFEEHFKKDQSIMSVEELLYEYNYVVFGPMREKNKNQVENYHDILSTLKCGVSN